MDFGENIDALSLSPRDSGSPLSTVSSFMMNKHA
jgi:hypothetical protein